MQMQQVKTYTSGLFKGEARYWHLHTVTDEGVGRGQAHTGRYTVVYEK